MTTAVVVTLFILLGLVVVFAQPSPEVKGPTTWPMGLLFVSMYGAWVIVILALLAAILRVLGHL